MPVIEVPLSNPQPVRAFAAGSDRVVGARTIAGSVRSVSLLCTRRCVSYSGPLHDWAPALWEKHTTT